MIAELPDVLWWPGDVPTGDPLFGELTEVVDRLIVDTAIQRDPAASLRFLTSVMAADRCPGLSDFAWARLTPWRHLVAQFFDNLPARQCLAAVEDVRIVYGSQNPDGSSGLSAAVLMAGWLATRLGWQPTGEMTLGRQGWQLALRGQGDRGHQRIDVTLRRTHDASLGCALVGVRLLARGEAPGSFAVERMTPSGLMTASESPTMPHVSRTVYAQLPDDITLLGEELQAFDRDRIYEEALAFAAAILPEGASQEATRP